MQDEEEIIYRDKLADCLRHFNQALQTRWLNGRELHKIRARLAEFCGVGRVAIGRYLQVRHLPRGEFWFRLACLLEIQGYQVIELERVGRHRRHIIDLLAYRVVKAEELAKQVGYSSAWGMYDMLKVRSDLSGPIAERYWSVYVQYKEQLEQVKAEAMSKYHIDLVSGPATTTSVPSGAEKQLPLAVAKSTNHTSGLLLVMQGTILLLKKADLILMSPAERRAILQLSAELNTLSAKLIGGSSGGSNGG